MIGCIAFSAAGQGLSRESAVALARGGDAVAVLVQLRSLLRQQPADTPLLADTVVVANWAGDDAFAVELLTGHSALQWPAPAYEAGARSARNRGEYRKAAAWFDEAVRRDPSRRASAAGAAMSLVEAGDHVAANARADELLARSGDDATDIWLAVAYVRLRSAQPMPALDLYQRVLRRDAASREAADGVRAALRELGAAQAALAQGGAAGEERERLDTDHVAANIRWADFTPEDPGDRFAEARAALAAADANLAALSPEAQVQRRRARQDRVLALRMLERMQDAVDAAQALHDEDAELPAYVQIAWADALLYLRRPREAIPLYVAALALQQPSPQTEVELSLMYAYLEAEDFDAARSALDAAIKHNPAWTRAPGPARPLPNGARARADITLALLISFGDDLAQAQRQLEALLANAPVRVDLQRELATIYLRRGWPRRALAQYRIAQSLEHENVALRLNMLAVERRLGHYDAIESALRALEAEAPSNVHVQREREEWDAFRGWQLDLSERRGQGDSAVFGNRERTSEATLASPLIGDFWRVYAQRRWQDAEIPEGRVAYDRSGVGLRYSRGAIDARLAWFDPTDGYSGRSAVEAALGWSPTDQWRFGAQAGTVSVDAPLRARYYGITGRSASVSAAWQRSDLGDLALTLTRMDLSDGNQRDGAAFSARERVLTQPHFKLDLRGELGASRNSLAGVPYFNPSRDAIALVGAVGDWMTWRHYENRMQQRFGLWAGSYWQEGFGRSGVLRASYEHEWQFGPGWSLLYGIGWFRQAYDGRRETRREVFAALHWGGLP